MTHPQAPSGERQVIDIRDYLPPTAARLAETYNPAATAAAPVYDQDNDIADQVPAAPADAVPTGSAEVATAKTGEIVAHHGRRLPELPAWANAEGFKKQSSELKLVAAAHVKYQIAMTPVYVLRAPVGYARGLRAWARWYRGDYAHLIRETRRERRAASGRKERDAAHAQVKAYKLERREHRLKAAGITVGGLAGAGVGIVLLVSSGGTLAVVGLGAGAVVLGSITGRPRAKDGTPISIPAQRDPMLGQDTIVAALVAAKVITEAQKDQARLLEPVHKSGGGLTTVIELPAGIPGKVLIKAHEAFAAALRADKDWVVLKQMKGRGYHQGAVRVWRGSTDPYTRVYSSPLLKARGPWDTWRQGIPMGVDGMLEELLRRLNDLSVLIGGQPRRGKTQFVIQLIACCLLDPSIVVRLADGKGAADYHFAAPLLATFFKRNPERLLALLELVIEEMEETYDLLSDMGKAKVDEEVLATGKVKRQMIVIDELRVYTTDPKFGKPIVAALADIAARGPAAAVNLVLATQRTTVEVVPGLVRDSVTARVAMRTDDASSSNAILGDGRAGAGYDASDIPGDLEHRGTAILDVDGSDPVKIKGFHMDEQSELPKVMALARQVRADANVLPGQREDRIEAELLALTGISTVAGGASGRGRTSAEPGEPELAASEVDEDLIPTLLLILQAFDDEEADFLPTAEIADYLHRSDPETWNAERIADPSKLGRDLATVLNNELAASGLAIEDQPLKTDRRNQQRGFAREQFDAYLSFA